MTTNEFYQQWRGHFGNPRDTYRLAFSAHNREPAALTTERQSFRLQEERVWGTPRVQWQRFWAMIRHTF